MSDERINRLEERLAWLERHVTEQDKAMLELAERLDRVQLELRLLRIKAAAGGDDSLPQAGEERPPHY